MASIKEIDVPSRIRDKELDSKKLVLGENTATDRKIPFYKDSVKVVKKTVVIQEESDSSSGSSNEESGSGSASGSDSNSGSGNNEQNVAHSGLESGSGDGTEH